MRRDGRGIVYFTEPLPGGRAQMYADVLEADGTVHVTYPVGSPAPRETVEAACRYDNGEGRTRPRARR